MSTNILTPMQAAGWMDGCISRTRVSVQKNGLFASSVGHSLNTTETAFVEICFIKVC